MGSQEQFCLRWSNHPINLLNVFDQLFQTESFVDVTLACDAGGHQIQTIKAHKVVLSACSPYFQKLLLDNPCQHPIVILNNVLYEDMKILVDFMYKGEISVCQEKLTTLIRIAENLRVKGLSQYNNGNQETTTNNDQGTLISSMIRTTNPCDDGGSTESSSTINKRRRLRSRRKSLQTSHAADTIDGEIIKEEDEEDIINTTDEDDMSANLQQTTPTSGTNLPVETRVHEGFSQETEEGQGSSMDSSNFLTIPPASYSSSTSHQQQYHALSQTQDTSTVTVAATATDNVNNSRPQSGVSIEQSTSISNKSCREIGNTNNMESSRNIIDIGISGHWSTGNVDVNQALEAALRHHQLQQQQQQHQQPQQQQQQQQQQQIQQRNQRTPYTTVTVPKREYSLSSSNTTGWTEDSLTQALDAIRSGRMSITKAAVTFGIPNTTLWQRTRREGIDTSRNNSSLSSSYHQATTGWTESNLAQALDAVRSNRMSVNRASTTYGIPSTTLWSRAKRYGIETHRRLPGGGGGALGSNCPPYDPHERDEIMWHALQAVKAGVISMTQASIKYNLPYTTLWKHFKKWEMAGGPLTIPLSMATSHSHIAAAAAASSSTSSTSSTTLSSTISPTITGGLMMGTVGHLHGPTGHQTHHHHGHSHGHSHGSVSASTLHSHPIENMVAEQTPT